MKIEDIAKSGSESANQRAFFAYCAVAHLHGWETADEWAQTGSMPYKSLQQTMRTKPVEALEWIHAIPNGGAYGDDGKTRAIRGAGMKAEGLRNGVADVFLPWIVPAKVEHHASDFIQPHLGFFGGLYIEFKKPSLKPKKEGSKGGMSEEQIKFKEYCEKVGYAFKTCYTWQEAVYTLKAYLGYV